MNERRLAMSAVFLSSFAIRGPGFFVSGGVYTGSLRQGRASVTIMACKARDGRRKGAS